MPSEQTGLYTAILFSALIFLLIVFGLIFLVLTYNRRKKDHITEKQTLQKEHEADLLKTQLEVQEQTMKTIAADLHDNIGQLLSLTSITLGSITVTDKKTSRKLDDSQQLVRRSIKELRQLANLLHGEKIIETGLIDAIVYETEWLKKSGNYIVNFDNSVHEDPSPSTDKDLILFRLLQEAINNIIKHSSATAITISLAHVQGDLLLSITDNGIGFIAEEVEKNGMGLSNLLRRAKAMQGEIDIISAIGNGTTIAIKVPYP
ncbi:ATP-binding protein [Daejeonella sp. JGW-45]|uniref:sensor histidine kinase n=1 Tax=Daejeonella sp. JGW-45 TaxID=3034148 RepID=UPI0023EC023E|nr:ATP-binding protein [Daejeonella sp. JGW-45]